MPQGNIRHSPLAAGPLKGRNRVRKGKAMRRPTRALSVSLLAAGLLGGCATHHDNPTAVEVQQLHDAYGYSRSLVMNDATHRPAPPRGDAATRPATAEGTYRPPAPREDPGFNAWWSTRNDARPVAVYGIVGPTFQRQVTHTTDRQSIHGNRVYDHYHQTTWRESVTEGVR